MGAAFLSHSAISMAAVELHVDEHTDLAPESVLAEPTDTICRQILEDSK